MFINSRNIFLYANRLAQGPKTPLYRCNNAKNFLDGVCVVPNMKFHLSAIRPNYAAADIDILPIPNNIDEAESTRFSPLRSRDISSTVILSQYSQSASQPNIDITADNSIIENQQDPHIQSYDCFGAVSLNSVMQSNVPSPFGGMHKFTHLNMPGGQWSQEGKFMSHNMQTSHYRALRDNARTTWSMYDQNATVLRKGE